MKMMTRGLLAAIAMIAGIAAFAAPVTEEQAALAARAWVMEGGDICAAKVGGQVVSTEKHEADGNAYFAVKLDTGIVFTAGDTECDPIVAITSAEAFDPNELNPLVKLLRRDAQVRAAMAKDRAQAVQSAGGGAKTSAAATLSPSAAKWAALLDRGDEIVKTEKAGGDPAKVMSASPRASVTDVRVAPILTTQWSQLTHNDSASGKDCYNYYTPLVKYYYYTSSTSIAIPGNDFHPYCGCSATALAQVLKRWNFPTASRSSRSYTCEVTDIRNVGGNSWERFTVEKTLATLGGTYSWSNMIDKPRLGINDTQREAIGHLTYDCAVALRSDFSAEGTGALPSNQKSALKDAFGYANAQYFYSSNDSALSTNEAMHRRAVYASLDAGAPVLMAIYEYSGGRTWGGHCVVGDGYGYASVSGVNTPFIHINMGWSGSDDVWYNVPNIDTAGAGYDNGNYNVFWGVIYNIFPEKTGEVVSGRVLDANGNPVAGATVTAKRGSASKGTTTTSASGVYAFVLDDGYSYELSATHNGATGSVTTGTIPASGSAIGNSWGNDIRIAVRSALRLEEAYVTLDRDYTVHPTPVECTEFEEGQEVCAYSRILNEGEGYAQGPFTFHYEFLQGWSGSTVYCTFDDTYVNRLAPHETHQHITYGDTPFAHLPVGTYRYRVTVTPGNLVSDYKRFAVVSRTVPLIDLSIEGPSTLRPGERAQYRAIGTYLNGATDEVDPVWSIVDGSSYASIDQDGWLTAGVDSRPHTVRILASYSENGGTVSGSKTITIQPAISLNEAVDNYDLVFTTGGDAPWYGQTAWHSTYSNPDADEDSASSGRIGDNQKTWMKTTVEGPGTLTFDYCVSSERNYDKFEFLCDGVVKETMSGGREGQYLIIVREEGGHTFEWRYTKDVSVSSGDDAVYIDNIQWSRPQKVVPVELTVQELDRDEMNAGSTRQMHADAKMSNGTTKYGVDAVWSMSTNDLDCASITPDGVLTAFESISDGEVTVFADYTENDVRVSTSVHIVIKGNLPLPSKPVITLASGDSASAILGWSAAQYVSTYTVLRADVGSDNWSILRSGLVGRTYSDASAVPGVDYRYIVKAVNATGSTASDAAVAYRRVSASLNPASVTVEYAGGEQQLALKANGAWTCAADSWVDVTPSSGSGDTQLRVAVSASEETSARFATLEVVVGGGTDHPVTLTLPITQAGKPIVEPKKCDFAFARISGGDASAVLYATSSDSGSSERILDANRQFRVRFGWQNVGEGDCADDVVNALTLFDSRGMAVKAHTVVEQGPIAASVVKASLMKESSWTELAPGPYAVKVTLNEPNRTAEANPENNEAKAWFALRDAVTVDEALGCASVAFATADDQWFGSKGIGPDGAAGVMTKHLGDGGVNTLTGTVTGAGTLTFSYRASSEARDVFTFTADGTEILSESGNGSWSEKSVHLDGEREHTLVWTYVKDAKDSAYGDCAFLAKVEWTPDYTFDPPTGVKAQDGGSSNIRVDWNAATGAVSYVVGRSENANGPWTVVKRGVTDTHIFDSKDLVGGVLYYYSVKAVFATGESAWSDTDTGYIKASLSTTGTTKKVPGSAGQAAVQVYANCQWTAAVTLGGPWLKVETSEGEGRGKVVFSFDGNASGSERTGKFTITSRNSAGDAKVVTITVKQGSPVELGREVSFAEAADCDLKFECSGDANWVGQTRVNHDGVDALRSGGIAEGGASSLSVAFVRSGTLSFWWGTSCWKGQSDGLELYVAGEKTASLSGTDDGAGKISLSSSDYAKKIVHWEPMEVKIPAGGAVVEWRFIRAATSSYGEEAGFVDRVVWTPDAPDVAETDSWWETYGANLMLKFPGMSKEKILQQPSPGSDGNGKFKPDGTRQLVYEDYVAGTNPFNNESKFTATIDFDEDGVPVIGWEPALEKADAALRHYQVYGQKDLRNGEWEPVPDGTEGSYNFFKVGVEMR